MEVETLMNTTGICTLRVALLLAASLCLGPAAWAQSHPSLPDGAYLIKVNGRHLVADGEAIQTDGSSGQDNRYQFLVEGQSDGSVRIRSRSNGRFLHVDGPSGVLSMRRQTNDGSTRFLVGEPGQRTGNVHKGFSIPRIRVTLRVKARGRALRTSPDGLIRANAGAGESFTFTRVDACRAEWIRWDGRPAPNRMLGAKATQSTTFGEPGGEDAARYAIDGDLCTRWAQTREQSNPYWEVDLGRLVSVEALLVWRGHTSLNGAIVATSATVKGAALMTATNGVTRYKLSNEAFSLMRPRVAPPRVSIRNGRPHISWSGFQRQTQIRYMRIYHPSGRGQISIQEIALIGAEL
jgi:hypothetical protein